MRSALNSETLFSLPPPRLLVFAKQMTSHQPQPTAVLGQGDLLLLGHPRLPLSPGTIGVPALQGHWYSPRESRQWGGGGPWLAFPNFSCLAPSFPNPARVSGVEDRFLRVSSERAVPAYPSTCLLKFKHLWKTRVRCCQAGSGKLLLGRKRRCFNGGTFYMASCGRGARCPLGTWQKASSGNLRL